MWNRTSRKMLVVVDTSSGRSCVAGMTVRRCAEHGVMSIDRYYQRFPGDVAHVQRIVRHLQSLPDGCAQLPSLGVLRPR